MLITYDQNQDPIIIISRDNQRIFWLIKHCPTSCYLSVFGVSLVPAGVCPMLALFWQLVGSSFVCDFDLVNRHFTLRYFISRPIHQCSRYSFQMYREAWWNLWYLSPGKMPMGDPGCVHHGLIRMHGVCDAGQRAFWSKSRTWQGDHFLHD